jgi:hypothetical protein
VRKTVAVVGNARFQRGRGRPSAWRREKGEMRAEGEWGMSQVRRRDAGRDVRDDSGQNGKLKKFCNMRNVVHENL